MHKGMCTTTNLMLFVYVTLLTDDCSNCSGQLGLLILPKLTNPKQRRLNLPEAAKNTLATFEPKHKSLIAKGFALSL